MKWLALVGLLLFGGIAQAEEVNVNVDLVAGGWSKHNDPKRYNQTHDSLGVKVNDYLVMRYHNSIRRESVVVGKYTSLWQLSPNIRVGGIVAAVSGYNSTGAVPAYLPSVSVDYGWLGTDIIIVPGMVTYAQLRIKDVHSFTWDSPLTDEKLRDNAIGYSYGSLGSLLSYWRRIDDSFDMRVFASRGFFGRADTLYDLGVRYNEWLDTDTFGVIGSYYPFGRRFAVELGAVHNGIDYNADYRSWDSDGKLSIVRASASYSWRRASYYAGIRYGSPWDRSLGWYVSLGAISLSGGTLESSGYDIENADTLGVTDLKFYPVLEIGLTHTF